MAEPEPIYEDKEQSEPTYEPDSDKTNGEGGSGDKKRRFSPFNRKKKSSASSEELKDKEESGPKHVPLGNTAEGESLLGLIGGEKSLFKDTGKKRPRFFAGRGAFNRRGRLAIGVGGGVIGLAVFGFTFFSFLNVFKLDHILKNIDAKTMARFNAQFSNRSDSFIQAYVKLRLMQFDGRAAGDANGNLFFRANKVSTGNAIKDWYTTLRTNHFEEDVLNKDGVFFTSAIDKNGHIRPAKITFRGEGEATFDVQKELSPKAFADLTSNDPQRVSSAINELGPKMDGFLTVKFHDSEKAARKDVKSFVKEHTHFWQVIKRRTIRKGIQNMIGVRAWRFFETTLDKYEKKKSSIQKKILLGLFPNDSSLARLLKCIFVGECVIKNDAANPAGQEANLAGADSASAETGQTKNGKPVTETVGTGGDVLVQDAISATEDAATNTATNAAENEETLSITDKIVNKMVAKFVGDETGDVASSAAGDPTRWWRLAKKIAWIHHHIKNHTISKMIKAARLAQMVALYTTYAIARDQMKTGQNSAAEVNNLMKTTDGFENSEGWSKVENENSAVVSAAGTDTTSNNTSRADYCKAGHVKKRDEFAWYCDDQKPNSGGRASAFENAYNNSIGYIFTPVAAVVDGVHKIPLLGHLLDFVTGIMTKLVGSLAKITIDPLLQATGITKDFGKLLTFGMKKFMVFAGAGPIFDGSGPGVANYLVAGSAGTAENSTRLAGGVASTQKTLNYSNTVATEFLKNQYKSESNFDKYASLDNENSLASKSLFAVSNLSFKNFSSYVGDFFSNVLATFGNIFSGRIFAASSDKPASDLAQWAGVDTYDIPQACQDLDPLDPAYLQKAVGVEQSSPYHKKANAVIGKIKKALTPENVRDSDTFWKIVYDKIGHHDDVENVAGAIYNCALLDRQVEGGLGYVYGYSDDGGLDSSSGSATSTPQASNSNLYLIGDSLTVGLKSAGLDAQLAQSGWQPTTSGLVSRRISGGVSPDGLSQLAQDQSAVSKAGSIVVELGTNEYSDSAATFRADLQKMLDKIRSYNASAQIYWVNYVGSGSFATPLAEKTGLLADFALSHNIKIVDWASVGGQYQLDGGVHPNGNYNKLLSLILNVVGSAPSSSNGGG